MRQFILAGLLVSLLYQTAAAQQNLTTRIKTVQQKENTVLFTIIASTPFYVGNNIYILHIGNADYKLSEQATDDKGNGILTFLLPAQNYATAKDGEDIYLTYGELEKRDGENMATYMEQHTGTCWYLGKFTKELLKK